MLRKPLGDIPVSIRKYETKMFGETMQRKVSLSIYYPSTNWEIECPYKDPTWQKAASESSDTSSFDNGVHTFCGDGSAPVSSANETYPIVLFSHGLCGYEMENTVLCADLASYGNVVVSIGHPKGSKILTYMDGSIWEDPVPFKKIRHKLDTVEPLWYEDFLETIKYLKEINLTDPLLKGRLDFSSLGIVGDSFGGCCGIAAILKDEKFLYAVNLDGGLFVPMKYTYPGKPILVLCNSLNFLARSSLSRHKCTGLEVKKAKKIAHYEFSDGVYLGPKGKADRAWADKASRERSEKILKFINQVRFSQKK